MRLLRCIILSLVCLYDYLYNEIQPYIQGDRRTGRTRLLYNEVDHLTTHTTQTATKQKGIKGKACQWNRRKTSPLTAGLPAYSIAIAPVAAAADSSHMSREKTLGVLCIHVIDSLAINRSGSTSWRRRGEKKRRPNVDDDGGRWSIRTNQKSIPPTPLSIHTNKKVNSAARVQIG